MKRISEAELTRTALSKGAVVSIDGRTINAARQQMTMARRSEKPAEPPAPITPAPPPEPLKLDTSGLEQIAQAGQQQTTALSNMVATLVSEIRAQRDASPTPIVGWDFVIEHNKDGRLSGIQATAIR